MAEQNNIEKAIEIGKQEITKLKNKAFNVFFFVYDTKGTPSGSLSYIYETAFQLKEMGYNVQMLHTEKEFVGVEAWMGEKYALLPHHNIEKDNVEISSSDFLFIPEIFSNVMTKTKSLPCKRVVILQNFDMMTELIPIGTSWDNSNMHDCITTSQNLSDRLAEVFRNVHTEIVRPCVSDTFTMPTKNKKLIINIVSKDQNDINAIVKPFKWKYPMYGFVTFRYLNGLSKEDFANALKESVATVWNDPFTDFGVSALEAMACGNIVIGKIPENEPEWMKEGDKLSDNGVWYYNTRDAHSLIASVVQSYLNNGIPEEVTKEMDTTVQKYRLKNMQEDIKKVYVDGYFSNRVTELENALAQLENKISK